MAGKIIVANPAAGRWQEWHREGDKTVLNTVFDAEPAIEAAKNIRNHQFKGYKGSKELAMVLGAILPMTIWMKLHSEGVIQDSRAFQRWLNDNPAFKAAPGNVLSHVKR